MESLDQFRRLEVREEVKNVFVMSLRLSDHQILHNIALSISLGFACFFRLYFVLPKFWNLRNLIKQLFDSLVGDETGYSYVAQRYMPRSLAIYHLISNARSWNNYHHYYLYLGAGSRLIRPVVKFVQGKLEPANEALYPSL